MGKVTRYIVSCIGVWVGYYYYHQWYHAHCTYFPHVINMVAGGGAGRQKHTSCKRILMFRKYYHISAWCTLCVFFPLIRDFLQLLEQ